jgi:hypothetical protein
MNVKSFVQITTWSAILLIIFGVLSKVIQQTPAMWIFFAFLCVVGLFAALDGRSKKSP